METLELNRFDRIAPFYDKIAGLVFGNSLIKAQECNLETITGYSNVLVLGGGTGKWLTKLLKLNSSCTVWYVEASKEMIGQAKKNLDFTDRIIFIHGTHENMPQQKFDVVITHFFVDMFTEPELESITQQIHNHLKSGGSWVVADFVNNKYWHGVLLKLMYLFFNWVGALDLKVLPNWDRIIQSEYFERTRLSSFYKGFVNTVTYIRS